MLKIIIHTWHAHLYGIFSRGVFLFILILFQNGSFVVIEEDHRSMPFTPYTFLIVHGGQLKKIPVLKHSPKRGKVKYTLANSELKQVILS